MPWRISEIPFPGLSGSIFLFLYKVLNLFFFLRQKICMHAMISRGFIIYLLSRMTSCIGVMSKSRFLGSDIYRFNPGFSWDFVILFKEFCTCSCLFTWRPCIEDGWLYKHYLQVLAGLPTLVLTILNMTPGWCHTWNRMCRHIYPLNLVLLKCSTLLMGIVF